MRHGCIRLILRRNVSARLILVRSCPRLSQHRAVPDKMIMRHPEPCSDPHKTPETILPFPGVHRVDHSEPLVHFVRGGLYK